MNELFGLSMTVIAAVCVALTALIFVFIAVIAVRNPVMFKTGLRNIPRRKTQTALIVVGLMLSTLIITAAFGTGDTMTHSVTNEVYTILGPADELLVWDTKKFPAPEDQQHIPLADVDRLKQQFNGDPAIAAIAPFLSERMPVLDTRTRLSEPNPRLVASRPEDVDAFGGLKDTDDKTITLAGNEIALNQKLADKIDGRVGDTVSVIYKGQTVQLTVKAIVPNTLVAGTFDTIDREGAAVNWDFLGKLTGRAGSADFVAVSNDGTTRGGLDQTSAVTAKLEQALQGSTLKVDKVKQEGVDGAELLGNVFTSIFVIFGLFSIAAGILLIFLIFVMLAAERKPEMGMARAVGAKRRQIVESFLSEGMGYDVGSAIIGLVAGIGVAAAMITFVKLRIGEDLGLDLRFNISLRSMIVSFCLGIIVTFIVVFIASWRSSRLNIVAAIRDLPETKPHNPEAATWRGYIRGVLNGFAALGVLIISLLLATRVPAIAGLALLTALLGTAGPWLSMVRNSNFGAPTKERKQGEKLPKWPFFLTLTIVGIPFVIGYLLAILVVRLTRDRRPASMPLWLIILGIAVAPLGMVLSALQDRRRPIAWGVGVGTVGAVAGLLLLQWGLAANRMAWTALGVSLIALWVALTLRHFHIQERLAFTVTSAVLLLFWYLLPGGRLSWLLGKQDAGPEMFFVTGAVLVTCGTFIVVYNADVVLPLLARFGNRFGRIVPAVKTAVAYPLTSRFRTGLTIGMIGLIMFVLSLQAALNTNFTKALSGDDARGGFDVRVEVNGNNLTDDFRGTLQTAAAAPDAPRQVDPNNITAVGQLRVAEPFEVDIQDPEWLKQDPATRKPEDEFRHYWLMGADAGFLGQQQLPLAHRAVGYETDQAVWDALKANPSLAIIPTGLTQAQNAFGPPGADDLLELPSDYVGDTFQPFTLNLRNRTTGEITPITVIGQTKDSAATFWNGIVVQQSVVTKTFPDSKGQQFFLTLKPGVDPKEYAKGIESILVQASADSLEQVIADQSAENRTFLEMFQGFLALGLLVGIAALGVISLRAVVERRQQIGMLRAIGYKRSMVQLSFLLESGFIALSGILLGLVLGLSFAATLFTSGEFGSSTEGLAFTVPWGQVGVVTAVAFIAAMVTTYLPARAASHVAVAEALRYE